MGGCCSSHFSSFSFCSALALAAGVNLDFFRHSNPLPGTRILQSESLRAGEENIREVRRTVQRSNMAQSPPRCRCYTYPAVCSPHAVGPSPLHRHPKTPNHLWKTRRRVPADQFRRVAAPWSSGCRAAVFSPHLSAPAPAARCAAQALRGRGIRSEYLVLRCLFLPTLTDIIHSPLP